MNEGKFISAKLPISESTRRKNPHLFGAASQLPSAEREHHDERQPKGSHVHEKGGTCRVVISIIAFRKRLLDDDNLAFGCKWLRDAVAKELRIDDGDSRITWEYGQVLTRGREGCVVKIETV